MQLLKMFKGKGEAKSAETEMPEKARLAIEEQLEKRFESKSERRREMAEIRSTADSIANGKDYYELIAESGLAGRLIDREVRGAILGSKECFGWSTLVMAMKATGRVKELADHETVAVLGEFARKRMAHTYLDAMKDDASFQALTKRSVVDFVLALDTLAAQGYAEALRETGAYGVLTSDAVTGDAAFANFLAIDQTDMSESYRAHDYFRMLGSTKALDLLTGKNVKGIFYAMGGEKWAYVNALKESGANPALASDAVLGFAKQDLGVATAFFAAVDGKNADAMARPEVFAAAPFVRSLQRDRRRRYEEGLLQQAYFKALAADGRMAEPKVREFVSALKVEVAAAYLAAVITNPGTSELADWPLLGSARFANMLDAKTAKAFFEAKAQKRA